MPVLVRNGEFKQNEKEEVTFKENVDYFELKDGTYYTMEALKKKFDCGDSLIYKRAKEFDIPKKVIAGIPCYVADLRFEKIPHKDRNNGRLADNFNGKSVKSYAEVYNLIMDMLDVLEEQRKQLNDKEYEHRKDTGRIVDSVEKNTGMLIEFVKEIKRNNSLLEDLLNYVTREKKDA